MEIAVLQWIDALGSCALGEMLHQKLKENEQEFGSKDCFCARMKNNGIFLVIYDLLDQGALAL